MTNLSEGKNAIETAVSEYGDLILIADTIEIAMADYITTINQRFTSLVERTPADSKEGISLGTQMISDWVSNLYYRKMNSSIFLTQFAAFEYHLFEVAGYLISKNNLAYLSTDDYLSRKGLRGSRINKIFRLITTECAIVFPENSQTRRVISDFSQIRDIIIHCNGNIPERKLLQFTSMIKSYSGLSIINPNSELFLETSFLKRSFYTFLGFFLELQNSQQSLSR